MFGEVVMGLPHHDFEEEMTALKKQVGAATDSDLSAENLKELVKRYKKIYDKVGDTLIHS
jgi:pyruvate,orthophosphate dikinase